MKPSVSFKDTATYTFVEALSREELEAAWYTRVELSKILMKVKKNILLMEKGSAKANNCDRYCTRGLETLTPAGQKLKQERRRQAREAVLDEQEFQREVRLPDSALLARLYIEETRVAHTLARAYGLADQEEAREIAEVPRSPLKTIAREPMHRSSSVRVLLEQQQRFSPRSC